MNRRKLYNRKWIWLLLAMTAFILLISYAAGWEIFLRFIFPNITQVIYPRANLLALTMEHLRLVSISSLLTIIIGVPAGIWVTRESGSDFLPVVNGLTSIGQTFPPVAVLALAVPLFGFGVIPTIIALFLYGLLPVIRNTITGLKSVPDHMLDAAYGLGMGKLQAMLRVEIPLAASVILAGIRISVIINIGTAMIGAVIGAGGLGSPVIAGLVQNNIAYIVQGVVPAALLAIIVDQLFANMEGLLAFKGERQYS